MSSSKQLDRSWLAVALGVAGAWLWASACIPDDAPKQQSVIDCQSSAECPAPCVCDEGRGECEDLGPPTEECYVALCDFDSPCPSGCMCRDEGDICVEVESGVTCREVEEAGTSTSSSTGDTTTTSGTSGTTGTTGPGGCADPGVPQRSAAFGDACAADSDCASQHCCLIEGDGPGCGDPGNLCSCRTVRQDGDCAGAMAGDGSTGAACATDSDCQGSGCDTFDCVCL